MLSVRKFGLLSVMCGLMLSAHGALAQDYSTKALADRAQIQDLITHYYYNLGRDNPENFAQFYADDGELIAAGDRHFKGKDAIQQAYTRRPPAPGSSPPPKLYAFNAIISNPLITVHGDTATSVLIFTEFRTDKKGDAPRLSQGREYSTFVKVNGHWLYHSRHLIAGSEIPEGWKE